MTCIIGIDGDAQTLINAALRAAEACNAGVKGPFTILQGGRTAKE